MHIMHKLTHIQKRAYIFLCIRTKGCYTIMRFILKYLFGHFDTQSPFTICTASHSNQIFKFILPFEISHSLSLPFLYHLANLYSPAFHPTQRTNYIFKLNRTFIINFSIPPQPFESQLGQLSLLGLHPF